MEKLTPVLYVEEIEPSLRFWIDALGFEQTAAVHEGDRLGFVALSRGPVEVMYQSRSNLTREAPTMAESRVPGQTALFLEVDDFEDTMRRVSGFEMVLPARQAPYGATEFAVREPAGNIVVFAHFGQSAPSV